MSDWTECLHRPSMLCGEKDEEEHRRGAGTVDMGEVLREWWREQDASRQTPQPAPQQPAPGASVETPPAPIPQTSTLPIRHKGLLLSSYWQVVNDVYAGVGDVAVVKSPGEYYVIRRAPKSRHWIDDTQLHIAGVVEKRLCIYGVVLSRDVERIAWALRSGRYALVAACDPRAVVRPPRREELYNIWRSEGYVVNTSPAKMALIRLDPAKKPKFAVDFLKSGCPIYSHYLNQILQMVGVPVQLTC